MKTPFPIPERAAVLKQAILTVTTVAVVLPASAPALEVVQPGYVVQTYASYSCPMPLEAIGMPRGMAFDPQGNLYLTQMSGYPDSGSIYRVSPDGTAVEWQAGFGTPRRIVWAGGSQFGDYLYLTDGNPSTVCRLGLDGAVSVFAGLNDTVHSLALDRTGHYGGKLFVATRGNDEVYAISPAGEVRLFSSFPGATPSGHLDLAFDSGTNYAQLLYAALDRPAGMSGVGGVYSLDPNGQATRFAPDVASAWSVAFPPDGAFGGDFFVCGRVGDNPHNALWRVDRNGQVVPFARPTIGDELQVLCFAPDRAMLVPEFSFAEQRVIINRITRHASVDIRPGSWPNPLNLRSRGVLPVALVGSPTLNVGTVDRTSIRLLNVPAIRSHYDDVTAPPTSAEDCNGSAEPPDGVGDLILHFETEPIVAALLDQWKTVGTDAVLPLTLTGKCTDQTPFEGTDCVVIRGNVLSQKGSPIAPGIAAHLGAFTTMDFNRPDCVPGVLAAGLPAPGPGSLDPTFDPTAGGTLPGIECDSYPPSVNALVLQPDGKVVIGGWFDRVNGTTRRGLARLNPDGTLDSSFQFACSNEFVVAALVQQPDQQLLVLGRRAHSGEPLPPYSGLIRLNADGSIDSSYTNYWEGSWMPSLGCLALQADGKILVGGEFIEPRTGLVRFNADGTLDETFNPPNLPAYDGDRVNAIVVQPDGKILVVGTDVIGFFRLNPDGSRDPSFVPAGENGASPKAILLQPDGRILIGLAGCCGRCSTLARLHPDGRMDENFTRANLGMVPWRLALQPDGRILLAGYPTEWGHDSAVCRLNPDGSIDTRFQAIVNARHGWPAVAAIALQPDGQILISGNFSSVNGFPAEAIARLNNEIRIEPPTCYGGPYSLTRFTGQTAIFTTSVAGTLPLRYQWLFNGTPIAEATNSSFVIPHSSFANTGAYSVVVSNVAGSVTSDSATLTVLSPEASSVWARRLGNLQGESCNDLAVDAAGNAYLVGIFLERFDLGGLTLTSAGAWDFFVAKYDPNGNLVWAQRGGGAYEGTATSVDDTATAVAVDEAGCVYVTGYYHGPADIGGRPIPATTNTHMFLAKYDAAGNMVWVLSQDGLPSIDTGGTDLAVDAAGNVYSAGFIHNSQAEPYYTAVVERRSSDGGTQWQRTFPVDYTPWDHRIAVDNHTNVFLSGTFWSHLAIGSLTATNRSQWASFFLVKFQQGEPEWLRYADMPSGTCAFADNISVDQLGNTLVCGHFTGTLLLGSTSLTSRGEEDVFLAKYSEGGELLWVRQGGGPGHDLAKAWTDALGGIYLASRFQGTTHLGNQIIVGDPNHGVCLAAMTSLGEPRWVELTGLPEFCRFELAVYDQRDIYLAGNFPGAATFGTNLLVSAGCADMFLAKLDIPPPPPHPADLTPSDWQMTSVEVDTYAAAWRSGVLWSLAPNPIPIDYVTRAGTLWRGGPCYEWDATVATAPLWWVACPSNALTAATEGMAAEGVASHAQDDGVEKQFVRSHPHPVMITVKPAARVKAWAVEDLPPTGWIVSSVSDGGVFDSVNGKVKWGPFYDHHPRTLKYKAWPPAHAPDDVLFAGRASFDGFGIDIVGPRHRRVGSRLKGVASVEPGEFRFALSGEPGARYVIETSADLRTWTPWATVTNTLGQLEFVDSERAAFNQRFYRAKRIE